MNKWQGALAPALWLITCPAWASSCEISTSQSDIDHGSLNRTTLPSSSEVELPLRYLRLTVHCSEPQALRLAFQAVAADAQAYRFGDWGRYRVALSEVQLDGHRVELAAHPAGRAAAAGHWSLEPGQGLMVTRDGQPLAGRRLTAQVEISARGRASALAGTAQAWRAVGQFEAGGGQRGLSQQVAFTPASCAPSLGQGGQVDFGRIGAQRLSTDVFSTFSRALSFSVRCDGPTRFAVRAKDNRAGSARVFDKLHPGALFGLGLTRGGQLTGAYRLSVNSPSDSQGNALRGLHGGGNAWQLAQPGPDLYHNGTLLGFAPVGRGDREPMPLSGLAAQLQVELYLAPRNALDLREELPLQGSATLEIIYL
jgi:hypothetical protein